MNIRVPEDAEALVRALDFDIADRDTMSGYVAIGLLNRAYRVADCIKNGVFHQPGIDKEELSQEIGDMLWHTTVLCTTLGLDITEIMQTIVEKLKQRFPDVDSAGTGLRG